MSKNPITTKIIAIIFVVFVVGAVAYSTIDMTTDWFEGDKSEADTEVKVQQLSNSSIADNSQESSVPVADTEESSDSSATSEDNGIKDFEDGLYTVEVNYDAPGNPDEVLEVALSVQDNKVQSVAVNNVKVSNKSEEYNNNFNAQISDKVVGKDLADDLDPGKLAGASLTQAAFLEGVAKIKESAKVE